MAKNLDVVSIETLQQRLLEEIEAQELLNEELTIALERERDLGLENELLWVYLQRKHPDRVHDAQKVLAKLRAGSELEIALKEGRIKNGSGSRTVIQRVRNGLGKLPGVHRAYHAIKNIAK